jgi:hypothetical protein
MTRRLWLALAAVPIAAVAQKKKPAYKGPEVELLSASATLEDGRLMLDGRLRNSGERPIQRLTVIWEILDSDRRVLTRQQGPVEPVELAPGEECEMQAQIAYHARAISFRVSFEDGSGRELRSDEKKNGPFNIEQ